FENVGGKVADPVHLLRCSPDTCDRSRLGRRDREQLSMRQKFSQSVSADADMGALRVCLFSSLAGTFSACSAMMRTVTGSVNATLDVRSSAKVSRKPM